MEFDIQALHEWCGRECSQRAWELWNRGRPDPDEAEKMLGLARAAQWHWSRGGKVPNNTRGFILLAYAHLKSGQPGRALKDLEELMRLVTPEQLVKRAFVFACIQAITARAMDELGRNRGRTHRDNARMIGERIEPVQHRRYFFDSLLDYAPWKSSASG